MIEPSSAWLDADVPTRVFNRLFEVRDPDRPCIVGAGGTLSYGQVYARAGVLANRLGPGPGTAILIGTKQPVMAIAILAAIGSGRAYLPVEPTAPSKRLAHIVEISRPSVAIAAQPLPSSIADELRDRGVPVIELDALGSALDGEAGPTARPTRANLDPAYILFTSGTTGDPKGVVVPSEALAHFLQWLTTTYGFNPDDVFLNQVPYTFDVSIVGLFGALLSGGAILSLSPDEIASPQAMFSRLDAAPLTVWVSTPSLVRLFVVEPRFTQAMLPDLRLFWLAGEPLSPSIVRELNRRFPRAEVWNAYGPTEATVVVTAAKITADLIESGLALPIGRALPGTDVWIAEPTDPTRRLTDGASGEIVIGGRQVALGYLNVGRPGEIQPPVPGGRFLTLPDGRRAYRTGDMGHRTADGWYYCSGRQDRQIKLHGYRIELEEIEVTIRMLPGVADAAVFVVDDDGRPDHLVAAIVPGGEVADPLPESDLDLSLRLRAALRDRLPSYALPRRFWLVRDPPIGSSGKLDRRALEEQLS